MIKDYFTKNIDKSDFMIAYDLFDFNQNGKLYGMLFNNSLYIPDKSKLDNYNGFKNIKSAIDSLKNLENTLNIESLNQRIYQNDFFNIKKYKLKNAFEDPIFKYKMYCIYSIILKFPNLSSLKLYNFNNFFKFFSFIAENDFMVFSDFLKSSYVNLSSTGLCFEIFDLSNTKSYMYDPRFNIYKNICAKNNFIIDSNNPGRIIYRVTERFYEENRDIYIDVYNSDINITKKAIYETFIFYINNIADKNEINLIDESDNIEEIKFADFYLKSKLQKNNIKINNRHYKSLFLFFLKNNQINGLKRSLQKIENAKTKYYNLSEDR